MRGIIALLLMDGFRRWITPAGILAVLAVALVPPGLTAAWVWTHQADVAVTQLEWDVPNPRHGEMVNVTAAVRNVHDSDVGAFDVTVRVGYYDRDFRGEVRWREAHNVTDRIEGLSPGEEALVTLAWNATGGVYQVEAFADVFGDEVREIEELNNYRIAQIQVRHAPAQVRVEPAPVDPNATATTNASLAIAQLDHEPASVHESDNVTFTLVVRNDGPDAVANATLDWYVCQLGPLGDCGMRVVTGSSSFDLPRGQNNTTTFEWRNAARGSYALVALLDPPANVTDPHLDDNVHIQQMDVERRLVWEKPEEKATAKDFYRNQVLLPLHFTLLVPLLAVFYAGSVVEEERVRGNLPYLLSRPVPRWLLPSSRFAVGFLVALVPVVVGIVLTYALLLGTPRADAGYLYWPLLFSALVVFVYGAVSTLVGVLAHRPYLVGLAYVAGFETLLLAGRRILVNGEPLVQDWVMNASLAHWLGEAFAGWDPSTPFRLIPEGEASVRALAVLVAIGIASLVGAAWVMSRREVD